MSSATPAFFHRLSTRQLLADLAEPADWTIYVGLGATIDRTGISWTRLIDKLLAHFIEDAHLRSLIVAQHGEIRAATIAKSLFKREYEEAHEERIAESIGQLLYGPQKYMAGRLLEAVALLALEIQSNGKSVAVVTPNYDEFLLRELQVTRQAGIEAHLWSPADAEVDLLALGAENAVLPENWQQDVTRIPCVYLHGFISQQGNDSSQGSPVISEDDYADTHDRSVEALIELFQDRNVLLVGTSVTDPPLVGALLAGMKSDNLSGAQRGAHKKYALLPLQDSRWKGMSDVDRARLKTWDAQRLREIGVTAIHTDYFIQSSQVLMEMQRAMSKGYGAMLTQPVSPQRYGSRLTKWWDAWFGANCRDVETSQAAHHAELVKALNFIRTIIFAPAEESMKLEVWVRWNPQATRELRLWASSVGTWPDINSMRSGDITAESRYKSVQAFCQGAPIFLHESKDSQDRWRSYLGIPIWLQNEGIPVAVVTLASMLPPDQSAITEKNLHALDQAITIMTRTARSIVTI